jgi:hypothetical protein
MNLFGKIDKIMKSAIMWDVVYMYVLVGEGLIRP